MDQVLTKKIGEFLSLDNPSDEQIKDAATMLHQCSPNSRGIFNQAQVRPRAMLPWIRTDLKKYYAIRQRGLERQQVKAYNEETEKLVEETLSVCPEDTESEETTTDEVGQIPVLSVRGKRADHDALPDEIKELWERNANRWKNIRKMHTQLALMITRPDYQPCDGNELCHALREADTALRNDYERYDGYRIEEKTKKDSVEVYTDNVKAIQSARTAITRGLARESHSDKQLQKIQEAVNVLTALKQTMKSETVERLTAIGIHIPSNDGQ